MTLSKEQTDQIVSDNQLKKGDTGSSQVQIALLTEKLKYLNEHFKKNKKDHHSRQGLMRAVSRRRSLLDYLHKKDSAAYQALISKLGIRK